MIFEKKKSWGCRGRDLLENCIGEASNMLLLEWTPGNYYPHRGKNKQNEGVGKGLDRCRHTALSGPGSICGVVNQVKGTALIKKLIYDYQIVFIVAEVGISTGQNLEWPASIAKIPKSPLLSLAQSI